MTCGSIILYCGQTACNTNCMVCRIASLQIRCLAMDNIAISHAHILYRFILVVMHTFLVVMYILYNYRFMLVVMYILYNYRFMLVVMYIL